MKTFRDSENREWQIAMNITAAKRVLDLLKVNLLEPEVGTPPLLTRLGTDIILLCDVLYAICKPQADQREISDEQFGQALGGDAIFQATKALMEELTDFFQSLRRTDRARGVTVQGQIISKAVETADLKLAQIKPDELVEKAFSASSTSSPESSESTPDR